MPGLDVHDCAQARNETYKYGKLLPGMILIVEPGLYFQSDDLTVPAKYRGIGVRIEDDVLVTRSGCDNLSREIPSTAADVEAWIRGIWKGSPGLQYARPLPDVELNQRDYSGPACRTRWCGAALFAGKLASLKLNNGGQRMSYVDGFVIPVPKSKIAEYKKMAQMGKKMWMKHGALEYFECMGDDLAGMPECGNFKTMANLKPSETAFFSFIVYKNKAHRNAVNKKVMAEMKKQPMPESMPFDFKRMAYGGFKTLVQG